MKSFKSIVTRTLASALATARTRMQRSPVEGTVFAGTGSYVLFGPDGQVEQRGVLVRRGAFHNLITDVGDEYAAKRTAGVAVNEVTGMRLGTSSAAVSKNGAGAALGAYVAGSNRAIDATFPTAASKGAGLGWRVTYRTTYPPGVVVANGIQEVVLTNETPLTDVAGSASDTLSRAFLSPIVNKGAADTLEVTWLHDNVGQ